MSDVKIVRGVPTEDEVAALIAGLVTVASHDDEGVDEAAVPQRWRAPSKRLGLSPLSSGVRGPDEWRWSAR